MSPRAACRLATLGFEQVYDYAPGKADWLARGLPREGEQADEPRALDFARRDVVTCAPDERVGAVRERVQRSPYDFALVVSAGDVLLGRLPRATLDDDRGLTAERAMEPGPSTSRADAAPARLLERLRSAGRSTAILTTPDGVLLGVVDRDRLAAG